MKNKLVQDSIDEVKYALLVDIQTRAGLQIPFDDVRIEFVDEKGFPLPVKAVHLIKIKDEPKLIL